MNEEIKIVVVKYITGQASAEETAEVKHWIQLSPENEELYIQLYETWHNSLLSDIAIIDTNKAFEEFKSKTTVSSVSVNILTWTRILAAAMVCVVVSFGIYYFNTSTKTVEWVQVVVPKGATKKMILPDGSSVWINAGSNIKYAKDFGKTNRTIYLNGEAYFDIAKSKTDVPFLVKTDKFTIRDVGTIFNVKAYPDEQLFETAVVEGKVSVEGKLSESSPEQSKVFLDAKQVLKIDARDLKIDQKSLAKPKLNQQNLEPVKVIQINASQINEYNGWIDDFLVFDDDTFEDITKILERRYNVRIDISGEDLKNYRYTGTFKNIKNISTVFNVIKETTPIHYSFDGSKISIEKLD